MTDLLDARGYEILLSQVNPAKPGATEADAVQADAMRCGTAGFAPKQSAVTIGYLGAVKTEHAQLTYDEDPHVVSRVEQQDFSGKYSVVLKDSGIRTSGLRLSVQAEPGTRIQIRACQETIGTICTDADGKAEQIFDVRNLCAGERAYLEQVHGILYRLLAEIDRVCKKHDLHYFLVFGGLLGSLRYGEIIPWDDDIDIAMTREDFERFRRIAPGELGEDFRYLDCSDFGGGAFLDFMCRVLYIREPVPVNIFRKVSGKCRKELENHLSMDIFILDAAADSPRTHKFHMMMIRGIYGLGMGHRAWLDREEYAGRDRTTQIAVRVLSAVGKWIPAGCIFRLHDWVSTWYQKKQTKDYFMSNGFLPFIHTRYSREWFDSCSLVKLGELTVCAPSDVTAYLKRAYYDYYHYPPISKRVPEHSPDADGVF
ncbi:MAG: LicD family protein [Clostridiales bacterium]|nr:LicD family protein [Clostridiales bacterium]